MGIFGRDTEFNIVEEVDVLEERRSVDRDVGKSRLASPPVIRAGLTHSCESASGSETHESTLNLSGGILW